MDTPKRTLLAEFIGVLALTFVGGGAIIVTGGEKLIVIALAHGLILAVMVGALLHVSGAQFNPAVSISLALIGKQPWSRAFGFVIVQVLGGICAAFLLLKLEVCVVEQVFPPTRKWKKEVKKHVSELNCTHQLVELNQQTYYLFQLGILR